MTDVIKDVHTEHCCAQHGCKYADSDCPVASGNKPQSYPCESCEWEKEDAARHTAAKDAEIQALRAERQAFFDQACKQADQRRSAESRAERLEEALREIERLMPDQAGPAWIAKTIASAALHDHDQEGKDG